MKTKTPWFGYILMGLLIGLIFSMLTLPKPSKMVWLDWKWSEYEKCIDLADGPTDSNCDSCWKAVFGYDNIVHSKDGNWYIWYHDSTFPTQIQVGYDSIFIETAPEYPIDLNIIPD